MTIEAWIRLVDDQANMANWARVVNKWWGSSGGYGLFMITMFNSNPFYGPYMSTADGSTGDGVGDTYTFTVGQWYHLAGVWAPAPGDKAFYVDGASLLTESAQNSVIVNPGQAVQIGSNDGSESFEGWIDEVRISSRARSADWISATHATVRGTMQTFGTVQHP